MSEENYGRVKKVYVECLADRAVTLELQRRMQADSPCDRVLSLDSSHSPFFSQPERLVATLLEALASFTSGRRASALRRVAAAVPR